MAKRNWREEESVRRVSCIYFRLVKNEPSHEKKTQVSQNARIVDVKKTQKINRTFHETQGLLKKKACIKKHTFREVSTFVREMA